MRAAKSGIWLSAADAAIVKGMLARGDRQHDIAAWFGVNGGRIAEIATGKAHGSVKAKTEMLPPPGPYLAGREAHVAMFALEEASRTINAALSFIRERAEMTTIVPEDVAASSETP